MSPSGEASDATLERAIVEAPRGRYQGYAFRHQSARYGDPRSGEGARLNGARFTPRGSFPTLYLATSIQTAAAELRRLGERQAIGLAELLPRDLYRYTLDLIDVLDLTDPQSLEALGISADLLVQSTWQFTQEVGAAAQRLGIQAVVSSSATAIGSVIGVFPDNLRGADLAPELVTTWATLEDVLRIERTEDPSNQS